MQIEWTSDAGRIIDALNTSQLPRALARTIRNRVPYDFTVIFGYVGSARPLALYDDFPEDRRRLHVDDYQEGPYLLDPFFLASTGDVQPGLWRLREIAPDRFYQGEYFRNYYARTGLAEEVGYLVDVHEDLSIVLSLMRRTRRFSKPEIRVLKTLWPMIDAACRRHWNATARNREDRVPDRERVVARAFRSIGEGVLTPREQEVVELTLRGHSADATGKLLGISAGTVRIHRRNIYSKLRINSQGELFSEFIAAITDSPSLPG